MLYGQRMIRSPTGTFALPHYTLIDQPERRKYNGIF